MPSRRFDIDHTVASAVSDTIAASGVSTSGISASDISMSEVATSEGYSEVKTEELRSVAESGNRAIEDILAALEQLKIDVAQTEEGWTSQGGRYFREVFFKRVDRFAQALEEFKSYPRELIAYADQHEGTDSRAASLVTEIAETVEMEHANWSEVTGGLV